MDGAQEQILRPPTPTCWRGPRKSIPESGVRGQLFSKICFSSGRQTDLPDFSGYKMQEGRVRVRSHRRSVWTQLHRPGARLGVLDPQLPDPAAFLLGKNSSEKYLHLSTTTSLTSCGHEWETVLSAMAANGGLLCVGRAQHRWAGVHRGETPAGGPTSHAGVQAEPRVERPLCDLVPQVTWAGTRPREHEKQVSACREQAAAGGA